MPFTHCVNFISFQENMEFQINNIVKQSYLTANLVRFKTTLHFSLVDLQDTVSILQLCSDYECLRSLDSLSGVADGFLMSVPWDGSATLLGSVRCTWIQIVPSATKITTSSEVKGAGTSFWGLAPSQDGWLPLLFAVRFRAVKLHLDGLESFPKKLTQSTIPPE